MYSKQMVIDYSWQYSRFYAQLLCKCEDLYHNYNGYASLLLLFNVLENSIKSIYCNYDDSFYETVAKAYKENYISEASTRF